ncbi:15183_t:CDS:2 [Funneliformis geosporum]|uniref:15183_t:CDS:1 n=1 Tax=Funneliformis geosporum TaxID=1117311 RepID=A0A9W4SY62_9GLOM|nr:15183_t:CDS:2 [Funneliformis geosporum]
MEWIPYSQFTNLKKIAEGGFGVVYRAIKNQNEIVALKRIKDSQNIYRDISRGLREIHEKNVIHRDLHSGNILLKTRRNDRKWYIGDLGLSQPVDNTPLNNEIYGVIPYIAPEIYKGVKLKLIQSTKFYSEFIKEPHPKAVYMRRTLSIMTKESNKSSSSSSILSNTGQEYISRDQEYDINDIQRISAAINFSKKRNIDELKAKNPSNHGKRYKIDDNIDPKFKD